MSDKSFKLYEPFSDLARSLFTFISKKRMFQKFVLFSFLKCCCENVAKFSNENARSCWRKGIKLPSRAGEGLPNVSRSDWPRTDGKKGTWSSGWEGFLNRNAICHLTMEITINIIVAMFEINHYCTCDSFAFKKCFLRGGAVKCSITWRLET